MADKLNKIVLYNHDSPVNGHEKLQVGEGTAAEAYWRELGYAPLEEEPDAPAAASGDSEAVEEWPLQSDPADYIAAKTDDDGEALPDLSDAVLERLALARRIVEAD